MDTTIKILKFQFKDVLRSRWIIVYGILLLLITELMFRFSGDSSKSILSLLNITLLLNPLVSIFFGTAYLYNSREFIELLLSQPIRRIELFRGLYIGLALPMCIVYFIATGLPIFMHSPENFAIILTLIVSGILLTLMFTAIALLISSKFDDKTMGLGIAFLFWFGFSFLYDGLILLIAIIFQNYPLEYPLIVLSFLNPIDLARIVVMLKLDSAALMGYTGAVFENFFGHNFGLILSLFILIIWSILPYLTAFRIFRKKNF